MQEKGSAMRKEWHQILLIDWICETSERCKRENQKIPEGADLKSKIPSLILDRLSFKRYVGSSSEYI